MDDASPVPLQRLGTEEPNEPDQHPASLPPPGAIVTKIEMHGQVVWEPGMTREESVARIRKALGARVEMFLGDVLLYDSDEGDLGEEELDRRVDEGLRARGTEPCGQRQDYAGDEDGLPPLKPGVQRLVSWAVKG